jgi:carbamoyl-phosphate synthase small subunit
VRPHGSPHKSVAGPAQQSLGAAAGAYVLLEDGTRFDGDACGADGHATGEVVFTTGMSGYQESMTDPSFARQLITFTYPHIGNYGASAEAMESDRVWARAAIMRAATNTEDAPGAERGWLDWLADCGVPAITGVDTRALVRHIRSAGAMRGGVFPERIAEREARELIAAEPPMTGLDLAREVTPERMTAHGDGDIRIAAIDTGIKGSIVRNLVERGATVELHPCTTPAEEIVANAPDAVFLANGPGDPAALEYIVATLRELIGPRPVFGICLGHQLLSRAVGLETFKLPFGHRGANHPVKDLETGRIEITSQNHGFAVVGPGGARRLDDDEPVVWETDFGAARLSHVNLYDRTVEGLTLLDVPGGTVQYHPEAGPGPHDSLYLFDRFLDQIRRAAA